MPARSSGRSYSSRRRAASSAGSFDAPSTATHAAVSVSASYYSPLADFSADRQHQAEEDAGAGREETVVGGKADEAVSSSTDSGVRIGQSVRISRSSYSQLQQAQSARLATRSTYAAATPSASVHSGQLPVGPVNRSASDTTSISTRRTRGALPRYVRDTTVAEQLCTFHTSARTRPQRIKHHTKSQSPTAAKQTAKTARTLLTALPQLELPSYAPVRLCSSSELSHLGRGAVQMEPGKS